MTRPHGEGGIPAVHDERVEPALERLRKNFYHLWKVLQESQCDPSLVERWRRATERSEEWRKARQYDEAVTVLRVALSD